MPNGPLETAVPVWGGGGGGEEEGSESVFGLMGHLSPYQPNPEGFGVREWPLIGGAKIVGVQVGFLLICVIS